MAVAEDQATSPPLSNWEALKQVEREIDFLSKLASGLSVAGIVAGSFVTTPGFLLLALAYRPAIQLTKLKRIAIVMRPLLEAFEDTDIQIYPCQSVPGDEPLDLLVIVPEQAYFIISIRSKSKEEAKVVFNEENETLYTKHKRKGLRKWLPCPLVELSHYQAWLGKNRKVFGISANAIRRYPVIKVLALWSPMEIEKHNDQLYSKVGELTTLRLSRKGTALVIRQEEIIDFVKECLAQEAKAN